MSSAKQALSHCWGFIGLGNMGGPMVLNLRKGIPTSDHVLVYDANIQAAYKVVEEATGTITIADGLAHIAKNADTIISCLPTPAIAEEVFRAMAGGGTKTRPDRLVIDCSTIDPGTSRRICSMLEHAGIGIYIDTPMSGGVVGARAGTLSFMVGGSKGSFSRVSPILHKMGRSVVHCGAQGTGLSAKLANNYLLAINNLATAEAMNFGVEAGLEPSTLAGIINTATGRNWASEINNPVPGVVETAPASREYKGGFATALMDKDLKLAVAAAQGVQAALPLSAAALRVYGNLAADSDYAGLDFSVIYRYIKGKRNAKL